MSRCYVEGDGYRPGRQVPRVALDVGPAAHLMIRAALNAHPERMVLAMAALTVACDYAKRCNHTLVDLFDSAREVFRHRNTLLPVSVEPVAQSIVRDYGNTPGFDLVCDVINNAAAEHTLITRAMVGSCMLVVGRLVAASKTTEQDFLSALSLVWERHGEWWTAPVESEAA